MFSVSSSPHIRTVDNTRSIMLDVIIALLPALAVAAYMFGVYAICLTLTSVAASVFFEWTFRRILNKSCDIGDLSAVVTGILLAFCLPPSAPLWLAVVGAFFAIIIVKQLFGGIGKNFMNPALAARAFLFSWPVLMSSWIAPLSYSGFMDFSMSDAVSAATPLADLSSGIVPANISLAQSFFGQTPGSMGEISVFALLLGGLYLLVRKVITPRIPLSYLLSVALISFIFPQGNAANYEWMLWQLFSGGIMLGAIFMATDYSTSPVTIRGQYIYGIGCGILTVLIRRFGSYPEGVSYAILIMNSCVWLIDKVALPRRYGFRRELKK